MGLRDKMRALERMARGEVGSFELLDGSRCYFDSASWELFSNYYECATADSAHDWPKPPEVVRKLTEAKAAAIVTISSIALRFMSASPFLLAGRGVVARRPFFWDPGPHCGVMNYPSKTGSTTSLASENSEVSPVALLVAVALTKCPSGTSWKGTKPKVPVLPALSVFTCIWPRKVLPSLGSVAGLEKNWMMKILFFFLVLGVLFRSPVIVVLTNFCMGPSTG